MEKAKKIKVIYSPRAKNSIREIFIYIEEAGYPETAEKFTARLYDFGQTLALFPDKYPPCKQPQFYKRNMRCAVFHKNYMLIYKQLKNTLIIYNVIHCNTIPASHILYNVFCFINPDNTPHLTCCCFLAPQRRWQKVALFFKYP